MTARRVIDDHKDLENIGELSHDELDIHVNDTPFMVLSGSVVPPTARYLAAGSGITIDDAGPGSGVTISADVAEYVFPTDLSVSLKSGRTFGRFASGELIPATGKTPAEVILLAISEPIDPTVNLNTSNILTSAFNTTGFVATVVNADYQINSAGASVSSVTLQYKIGAGSWTTLTTSTDNPLVYNHVFEATPFFTNTINYRYIVTDSQGASTTSTDDIIPQAYLAPTKTLTLVRTNPGGITGETNTKREKGNVSSTLSGAIVRQRVNVPITSYSVQYSTNNSTWTDVPGLSSISVSGNPASINIPSTVHNDATLKSYSTLYYRISVTDEYQTTYSSITTVNFYNVIWYGPSGSAPNDSTSVRNLTSKVFTDHSNPFNLETGTIHRIFSVALPNPISLTEVLDLDALNANITFTYILTTLTINDGGEIPTDYKLYTMTNAIPYTSNHRHQIKRS
jgi:hypothetical protein